MSVSLHALSGTISANELPSRRFFKQGYEASLTLFSRLNWENGPTMEPSPTDRVCFRVVAGFALGSACKWMNRCHVHWM